MELTFVDRSDHARTLAVPDSGYGITIGTQELREYFGIDWTPNLGDLLAQFVAILGNIIPARLPDEFAAEERAAMVQQLDRSNSEDPGRLYCYAVQRNPMRVDGTPGQRSEFNSQKTELLRPELFARLRHEPNVSFRYSDAPEGERTDDQIHARFK